MAAPRASSARSTPPTPRAWQSCSTSSNHLGPAGNYSERFGSYFTDRHQTAWGQAVNLDGPGSEEVRRFCCDNAPMWLCNSHVGGLRPDAVHALIDALMDCNLAGQTQRLPKEREQSSELLLTSDPMIELNASGAALPPDSVVVLGPAEL
jgi:1,4-alpha-glucan branching enzyme